MNEQEILELSERIREHRIELKDKVMFCDSIEDLFEVIAEYQEYVEDKNKNLRDYSAARLELDLPPSRKIAVIVQDDEGNKKIFELSLQDEEILAFATAIGSPTLDELLDNFKYGNYSDIYDYYDLITEILELNFIEMKKALDRVIVNKNSYSLTNITMKTSNPITGYASIQDIINDKLLVEEDEELIPSTKEYYRKWSKELVDYELTPSEQKKYGISKMDTYNTLNVLTDLKSSYIAKQTYYNYFTKSTKQREEKKSVEFFKKFFINLSDFVCMNHEQAEKFLNINGYTLEKSRTDCDRLIFSLLELDLDLKTIDYAVSQIAGFKALSTRKYETKKMTADMLIKEYKAHKSPISPASTYKYMRAYQQELNKIDRFLEPREEYIVSFSPELKRLGKEHTKLVMTSTPEDEIETAKSDYLILEDRVEKLKTFKESDFRRNGEDKEWTLSELNTYRKKLIRELRSFETYYANFKAGTAYTTEFEAYFTQSIENELKRLKKALNQLSGDSKEGLSLNFNRKYYDFENPKSEIISEKELKALSDNLEKMMKALKLSI